MQEVIEKKECVICHKIFVPKSANAICCSAECSTERNREKERCRRMMHRQQKKIAKEVKVINLSIAEIQRKAREAGMIYGKYVLMMGRM